MEPSVQHIRQATGDGQTVAATLTGRGTPVLFLHGIPGSRVTWAQVTAHLGPDLLAIVPDLLGFGDSSEPTGDFHAFGQAEALAQLMTALGHPAFHLVGFDFGGPTAIALTGRHASRVRSLTLISTNAFPDTPIPGPLGLARVPVVGDLMFAAMCSLPGLAGMWAGAVGDKRALPAGRFIAELPDRRGRRWTRRIFLDSLRHLHDRYTPIDGLLSGITCPTLVVWGDADPFFPLDVGQRTARAIPAARLEVLRGCGHFAPGERPQALAALVRTHVSSALAMS